MVEEREWEGVGKRAEEGKETSFNVTCIRAFLYFACYSSVFIFFAFSMPLPFGSILLLG